MTVTKTCSRRAISKRNSRRAKASSSRPRSTKWDRSRPSKRYSPHPSPGARTRSTSSAAWSIRRGNSSSGVPATAPKWCRATRGTGFRAARPSYRSRASRSNRGIRRTVSTPSTRWCAKCATACSRATPRRPSRQMPRCGSSGRSSNSNGKWAASRYGKPTARP